ncbi:hypothetical protein HYW75_04860 [Candidatus Pacearchaeota archaeon]|nr:hypothetical protein [Candidatus Pacearchaeota archaeon]
MEEPEHIREVITVTQKSLTSNDALRLNQLSNQTIHSASCLQDPASITLAVIIYTLSKLIERKDFDRIKNWSKFVKKMNSFLNLAVKATEKRNYDLYESYIERARKLFDTLSIKLKPYIEEVLRKSSINKAGKIYEHGISLGQTAKILGITQWELFEYAGQREKLAPTKIKTLDVIKRVKMAMDFLSVEDKI